MRRIPAVRQMAKLMAVQRISRLAADAALADARAAAERAEEARSVAIQRTREAHARWSDYLTEPAFAPELSNMLASGLIDRESAQFVASEVLAKAADLRDRREFEWQSADARVTASERSMKAARRNEHRRYEERRLVETASRFTYDWSRS